MGIKVIETKEFSCNFKECFEGKIFNTEADAGKAGWNKWWRNHDCESGNPQTKQLATCPKHTKELKDLFGIL